MQYQAISTIIAKNDIETSAAESHGMAVGMLCVNDKVKADYWLQELLQDNTAINVEDQGTLEGFFQQTRQLLLEDEYAFAPLLPEDDSPLNEQIEGLRQWCQGFLFGIGAVISKPNWPDEVYEIVKDISEFTKLDSDAEGEEAENDFMEITEYLRVAVLFLRKELNAGHEGTVH
jgi:uncharacterized protein YgfB (UPF0149 family)